MTNPIDHATAYTSSPGAELAALLVENEAARASTDSVTEHAARQAYLAEAASQASELHHAANAIATGALVGAAFTIAGGACTLESAHLRVNSSAARAWTGAGKALADLAQPAKALVGDSSAESHRASAKEAETRSEAERWVASDAQRDLEAANRRGDKILELAQSIEQEQNAAAGAIIGRI